VTDFHEGAVFAGHRIEGLVGRGGMGVVYRARHLALDREVALKLIATELAAEPGFRERFQRESRIAAALDDPHVVTVHHAGEEDGILFITMRLIGGEDLGALLKREGRVAPERAAGIVTQLAAALDAAHRAGLVHRDVKPANVLVEGEHVFLTDFGLTKRDTSTVTLTRTGEIMGTLDYIAPEQIRGQPLGPFTDVYALACMTVHLLTGDVPFTVDTEEGKLWAHLSEPAPRVTARRPGLPLAVDAVLTRAMAKDPALRYATAGEFAADTAAAVAAPLRKRPGPAARVAAARARESAVSARPGWSGAVAPRAADPRRAFLAEALREPFNLAVLGALVVVGIVLGTPVLMAVLALAVYGAAVARSYLDADTRRRALARQGARDSGGGD
jgi:serine/threonine protein kinase